jgi:hypothetical protein
MTRLRLEEFGALVNDVRPAFAAAEVERLSRPDWLRTMGDELAAVLSERDPVLLTVSNLRQYPTQEVLGTSFGLSRPSVSCIVEQVLPLLQADGRDRMRLPGPGRKHRPILILTVSPLPSDKSGQVQSIDRLSTQFSPATCGGM